MPEGKENKFGHITYRADHGPDHAFKWTPSIFMPRWASRLTLTVTDVRVQRLQDISEEDAWAEGITAYGTTRYEREGRDLYALLWNSINGAGAWNNNPWVVALSFTVRKGNIDV